MGNLHDATVRFLGEDAPGARGFQGGVCLHGHTLHSEECLWFLPRYLGRIPGALNLVSGVAFSRAFFTPPLPPDAAARLERKQIEKLGLQPMVSLTDHDTLQACFDLPQHVPLSVEWTVPYQRTIFHLGIHHLSAADAREWMAAMAEFTRNPEEPRLAEILCVLAALPQVLVVLNHPFWLEEGVEEAAHVPALQNLLRQCGAWFHAFELNGTRPWAENAATIKLAEVHSRPVISGGDRHGCEAAACINLTNAATFAEFVGEIRDGRSSVLFMPHYRQPLELRILEAACDILRPYPEYPQRKHWMDRFFYRGEDGVAQSLASLWRNREPWVLRPATGTLQLLGTAGMRGALRACFARGAEAVS